MAGNGSLCYIIHMATEQLKTLLERAETWPEEDQDEHLAKKPKLADD